MTKKQQQLVDKELEQFIHRLNLNGVATYDQCFAVLPSTHCVEMRQSYMKFSGEKTDGKDAK